MFMERDLTGSVLLGSGVVSHILVNWAEKVAFSSSLLLQALILAMIGTGAFLLVLELRKEFRESLQDLSRKEMRILAVALALIVLTMVLAFLGLPIPLL